MLGRFSWAEEYRGPVLFLLSEASSFMTGADLRGWCFTFISLLCMITMPMLWVELKQGPRWREERRVRVAKIAQEKKRADAPETEELSVIVNDARGTAACPKQEKA